MPLAAFTAFAATFGSLYLSEGAHLEPCLLCWWQRVLMYPQAVILGLAAWRRERTALLYSLWLSVIGAGVAIYHIALQSGLGLLAPCGGGALVSCTTIQVQEFGYVTIPVMSLTGFGLLVLLAIFGLVRWPAAATPGALHGASASNVA
ncbi:MAG: disulfide bond formation protein B [Candidatus Andersenbacteria bacterium]